ncbi:MAG: hypothetical protein QS748_11140 [Candidatus Endonucleobacter bathymodioli]|uniref:Uncharacterized protein n=1 Tax=Candidatus Endonucleibacter bathymodioli TaxID=539814 RepID=A0AA90NUP4_9GAMM|nr:hypothetical protein [Candidatus Endonucleobacter bathymodioli]
MRKIIKDSILNASLITDEHKAKEEPVLQPKHGKHNSRNVKVDSLIKQFENNKKSGPYKAESKLTNIEIIQLEKKSIVSKMRQNFDEKDSPDKEIKPSAHSEPYLHLLDNLSDDTPEEPDAWLESVERTLNDMVKESIDKHHDNYKKKKAANNKKRKSIEPYLKAAVNKAKSQSLIYADLITSFERKLKTEEDPSKQKKIIGFINAAKVRAGLVSKSSLNMTTKEEKKYFVIALKLIDNKYS